MIKLNVTISTAKNVYWIKSSSRCSTKYWIIWNFNICSGQIWFIKIHDLTGSWNRQPTLRGYFSYFVSLGYVEWHPHNYYKITLRLNAGGRRLKLQFKKLLFPYAATLKCPLFAYFLVKLEAWSLYYLEHLELQ